MISSGAIFEQNLIFFFSVSFLFNLLFPPTFEFLHLLHFFLFFLFFHSFFLLRLVFIFFYFFLPTFAFVCLFVCLVVCLLVSFFLLSYFVSFFFDRFLNFFLSFLHLLLFSLFLYNLMFISAFHVALPFFLPLYFVSMSFLNFCSPIAPPLPGFLSLPYLLSSPSIKKPSASTYHCRTLRRKLIHQIKSLPDLFLNYSNLARNNPHPTFASM